MPEVLIDDCEDSVGRDLHTDNGSSGIGSFSSILGEWQQRTDCHKKALGMGLESET